MTQVRQVSHPRKTRIDRRFRPPAPLHLRISKWFLVHRFFRLAMAFSKMRLLMHPNDPDHLNILAQYYFERNRFQLSVKTAARAFEKCHDLYARASLAVLASLACARLDDASGAGFWLRRALKTRPEFIGYVERDQFLAKAALEPEFHQSSPRPAGLPDLLIP